MVTVIFVLSRSKDQHGAAIEVFKTMWKNYVTVWDAGSAGNATRPAMRSRSRTSPLGAIGRMKNVQPALVEGFPTSGVGR